MHRRTLLLLIVAFISLLVTAVVMSRSTATPKTAQRQLDLEATPHRATPAIQATQAPIRAVTADNRLLWMPNGVVPMNADMPVAAHPRSTSDATQQGPVQSPVSTYWLRGVVVTANREPVEQFEVSLLPFYGPTVRPDYGQVFTTSSGEFELAWKSAGPVDVVVKATGFVESVLPQIMLVPNRQETVRQEVILRPAGRLSGVVLNEVGHIVPGAHVELGRYEHSVTIPELPEEIRNSSEARAVIQEHIRQSNPNPWHETDQQGHFELVDLPQGTYPLYATHPDYFPTMKQVAIHSGSNEQGVQLILSKQTGSILIHVIDGKNVPGANQTVNIEGLGRSTQGRTNSQGVWRAGGLPPGTYRVSLISERSQSTAVSTQWTDVQVSAGVESSVVFEHLPRIMVAGEVDRGGQPASGISIRVNQMTQLENTIKNATPIYTTASVTTDGQGRFELTNLTPGSYQLVVGQELESATMAFSLTATDQGRFFRIRLGMARLAGYVRDGATGQPIDGTSVKSFLMEPLQRQQGDVFDASPERNVTTDAQGFYQLEQLALGHYLLDIEAPSYGRIRQAVDITSAETRQDIQLFRAGQLIITVTNPQHIPLSGIDVSIIPRNNPQDNVLASTDLQGMVQLTDLTPGAYEIVVSSANEVETFRTVVEINSAKVERLAVTIESPSL